MAAGATVHQILQRQLPLKFTCIFANLGAPCSDDQASHSVPSYICRKHMQNFFHLSREDAVLRRVDGRIDREHYVVKTSPGKEVLGMPMKLVQGENGIQRICLDKSLAQQFVSNTMQRAIFTGEDVERVRAIITAGALDDINLAHAVPSYGKMLDSDIGKAVLADARLKMVILRVGVNVAIVTLDQIPPIQREVMTLLGVSTILNNSGFRQTTANVVWDPTEGVLKASDAVCVKMTRLGEPTRYSPLVLEGLDRSGRRNTHGPPLRVPMKFEAAQSLNMTGVEFC